MTLRENNLCIFTPCLPHHLNPVHCDQTKESLSVSRVMINTGTSAFHSCTSSLWNHHTISVRSATSTIIFRKHLKMHLFDLVFLQRHQHTQWPIVTKLLSRVAVGHWFGCHTTEPRYIGDIGAIEIWLIDWLNQCGLGSCVDFLIKCISLWV